MPGIDHLVTTLIASTVAYFFLRSYLGKLRAAQERALAAAAKGKLFSEGPKAQHPFIDPTYCIGCATCTTVCPEGDVLAMLGGKAVIANGHKCIGHGVCAEACPVGAITMVMASPGVGADMPVLTSEYETTIPNLFIAGELGGLALIKNAINQGRDCVDTIANRLRALPSATAGKSPGIYDVLIVGAGPAGISASLRATEHHLKYITLERDEVGGAVAKFPRQKLVMTSPLEFPTYGKFNKTELAKEHLLAFWDMVLNRADFNVCADTAVENIRKGNDGIFTVSSLTNEYRARAVILGIGRAGTPRKLGVKGEELPNVMYRLIEADHYRHKNILVVGGGDSAVEAAMGLARQEGNRVILSYRKSAFSRIKERNEKRLEECVRDGQLKVLFNSMPLEFRRDAVVLSTEEGVQTVPNDYVWIFAGGKPPNDFLKKIGVGLSMQDLTSQASQEATLAATM
jgi:thioredoxin reductase/Pyruvate/2-oxoacid:ferredoxin oxidoreductase delta subunit